jgi:hypothetical protein
MNARHGALQWVRLVGDAVLGALLGVCAVGALFVLAAFVAGLSAGA